MVDVVKSHILTMNFCNVIFQHMAEYCYEAKLRPSLIAQSAQTVEYTDCISAEG